MERYAFTIKLKKDKVDAYVKAHEKVWSEVVNVLRNSGRFNYSLWVCEDRVFGYYEVEEYERSRKILNESRIFSEWNEQMKEYIDLDEQDDMQPVRELNMIFSM